MFVKLHKSPSSDVVILTKDYIAITIKASDHHAIKVKYGNPPGEINAVHTVDKIVLNEWTHLAFRKENTLEKI